MNRLIYVTHPGLVYLHSILVFLNLGCIDVHVRRLLLLSQFIPLLPANLRQSSSRLNLLSGHLGAEVGQEEEESCRWFLGLLWVTLLLVDRDLCKEELINMRESVSVKNMECSKSDDKVTKNNNPVLLA